jgi:hypothetical protein
MSLEVMVFKICLNSSLVERASAVTIRVPSDRMTRSNGVIMNANGRLRNDISWDTGPGVHILRIYLRHALDDHERNISVGCYSTADTFLVVL